MAKHRQETKVPGTPESRARMIVHEYTELRSVLLKASQIARTIESRIEGDNSVRMNGSQISQIKGTVDLTLHAAVEGRETWLTIHRARTED